MNSWKLDMQRLKTLWMIWLLYSILIFYYCSLSSSLNSLTHQHALIFIVTCVFHSVYFFMSVSKPNLRHSREYLVLILILIREHFLLWRMELNKQFVRTAHPFNRCLFQPSNYPNITIMCWSVFMFWRNHFFFLHWSRHIPVGGPLVCSIGYLFVNHLLTFTKREMQICDTSSLSNMIITFTSEELFIQYLFGSYGFVLHLFKCYRKNTDDDMMDIGATVEFCPNQVWVNLCQKEMVWFYFILL